MEKRKMEISIMSSVLFLLFFVQNAYALQEMAGPLVINVPINGSGYAYFGLINDESQTISVSISSTGSAAQYLSFPSTVTLPPDQPVYVKIIATIPASYNVSSGTSLSGYLYATQQGSPGQVQINIQMQKNITVLLSGTSLATTTTTAPVVSTGGGMVYTSTIVTTTSTTKPTTTTTTIPSNETTPTSSTIPPTTTIPSPSPLTGFVVFVSSPLGISILLSIIVVIVLIVVFHQKWYVPRKIKEETIAPQN